MEEKKYNLEIPSEFISELGLDNTGEIQLKKEGKRLIIEKPMNHDTSEEVPLKWFLIPSILMTISFYAIVSSLHMTQIPMTGHESISSFLIYLGVFSGVISFSIFFIRGKRDPKNRSTRDIYWRNVPTIIFSSAVILFLVLMAFFWVIGIVFEGASFDKYTATAIFLLFICVINYFMIYSASLFTSEMIINVLIIVIVGGIFFSMITNSESQWWQINFSFLGTNEAVSSWPFNITLMISALLMIALIDYLFVTLKNQGYTQKGLIVLRILLTLLALALGGVGFFPNNAGMLHELHDKVAGVLVTLVIILIIGIRWLLPQVTKQFLVVSYTIAVCLVLSNILFENVGYFSLTVFELIAFGLAFCWILLLLQQINRLTTLDHQYVTIPLEEYTEINK